MKTVDVEMVSQTILEQTPNEETREELYEPAVLRLANYYQANDYTLDDLPHDLYSVYDLMKWTLSEMECET